MDRPRGWRRSRRGVHSQNPFATVRSFYLFNCEHPNKFRITPRNVVRLPVGYNHGYEYGELIQTYAHGEIARELECVVVTRSSVHSILDSFEPVISTASSPPGKWEILIRKYLSSAWAPFLRILLRLAPRISRTIERNSIDPIVRDAWNGKFVTENFRKRDQFRCSLKLESRVKGELRESRKLAVSCT